MEGDRRRWEFGTNVLWVLFFLIGIFVLSWLLITARPGHPG
jgi:hypothetical protein